MGHPVNPVSWRVNSVRYWHAVYAAKKDLDYLSFECSIFMKVIFIFLEFKMSRYKLYFCKCKFIQTYWQNYFVVDFKSRRKRSGSRKRRRRIKSYFYFMSNLVKFRKISSRWSGQWVKNYFFFILGRKIRRRLFLLKFYGRSRAKNKTLKFFKKKNFCYKNNRIYIKKKHSKRKRLKTYSNNKSKKYKSNYIFVAKKSKPALSLAKKRFGFVRKLVRNFDKIENFSLKNIVIYLKYDFLVLSFNTILKLTKKAGVLFSCLAIKKLINIFFVNFNNFYLTFLRGKLSFNKVLNVLFNFKFNNFCVVKKKNIRYTKNNFIKYVRRIGLQRVYRRRKICKKKHSIILLKKKPKKNRKKNRLKKKALKLYKMKTKKNYFRKLTKESVFSTKTLNRSAALKLSLLNNRNMISIFENSIITFKKKFKSIGRGFANFFFKPESIALHYVTLTDKLLDHLLLKQNNFNNNFYFISSIFKVTLYYSINIFYFYRKAISSNFFSKTFIFQKYLKKIFYKFMKFLYVYRLKVFIFKLFSHFSFFPNFKFLFLIRKVRFATTSVYVYLNYFFSKLVSIKVKKAIKNILRIFNILLNNSIIGGYKFLFSGRFSRKDRATFQWKRVGFIPTTFRIFPLFYGSRMGVFKYGKCTVRMWISPICVFDDFYKNKAKISKIRLFRGINYKSNVDYSLLKK